MALDLSVDRVVNILRTENQNIPIGEINQGDRTYLLRSQGQFQNLDEIRNLVVQTKTGVPVYLKDIAEVKDSTEDARSMLRINGKPGVRMQITKQSGTNTVQIAQLVRQEIERTNREVPGVRLILLEDNAKYIERSIGAVREHVMFGSVLVILVIFLFLRNFRSTLIVATSIPISVIGTFALLYFAGMTLNTMTFGGLALGVGMVVDAAIVVLENSFRHMEEHGKDRMTASIDGSEEVWSAILASILTHIAVFVPLMFLTGISSVMFVQLSIVVCFSLAMSLFVAVTLVPVLCSRLLVLPAPADQRRGISGWLYTVSDKWLNGDGRGLPPADSSRAQPPPDGGRRRGGFGGRRRAHSADHSVGVQHADRRRPGQRAGGAADRHADRAHRRGDGASRADDSADCAGDGVADRQRGRRRQQRTEFRRADQSREPDHLPGAEGRAEALERSDRHRSAQPAARASRASSSGPTPRAATTRSTGSCRAAVRAAAVCRWRFAART